MISGKPVVCRCSVSAAFSKLLSSSQEPLQFISDLSKLTQNNAAIVSLFQKNLMYYGKSIDLHDHKACQQKWDTRRKDS
ncbi:hypothetical protein [Cyclobacterium jeungdonense]|uniref:Uncharacterized protein n=1 Tax=Cyclobacterium jeungdonense TaxID=708087 RepID=A0ABT8C9F9_9BACT|nr:hypothetical protein [Cyclobacterium jeungdonense]MDN3688722.1 hypothetical protein [Cyclobacterium jeungdonense]